MEKDLIHIENLTRKFENTIALDRLELKLEKGKFVTLVGPDGAGKTTLLRLLAALLLPTSGKVTINGLDTKTEGQKIHECIGYMPQRFGLYEDLTVLQNLTLYADLQGVMGEKREKKFEELLEMTRLKPFIHRLAGALSGGMKQKLGLSCALLKEPTLLLLDEPSVGVDPISRRELWTMMHEFHKSGVSIIWSTSYLDEAERGDWSLLLNGGKLLFEGPPSVLIEKMRGRVFATIPKEENKRAFLSEVLKKEEVIDGKIEGDKVRILTKVGTKEEGWMEESPSFEDGLIDLLGGGPGGDSPLQKEKMLARKEKKEVVVAKNITKKFGTFTAVDNISFSVKSGEIFGLLGPNGAGKSTTFRMLCGLLKQTSGEAHVNGVCLDTAPSEARSHIGYMAQKFSLYGDLSARQNLDFFSGIYQLEGRVRKERVDQMISLFKLEPFLSHSAKDLPIGYKQRLALACALMHRPRVLFLDEPTSGVDPITRREFWNHINALAVHGCTIMVTTHFMDEADYCDRIGLIYQSKMINMGTPDELKKLAGKTNLEETFIELIERHGK